MCPQAATAPPAPGAVAGIGPFTFHHVGVAVRSIEKALETYLGVFGFRQAGEVVAVPGEGVRVVFVEAGPGVLIELVEGVGDDSPVSHIVERTGAGPYHLCYRVEDLDSTLRQLRRRGFHRLKRFDSPAEGMRRFAFCLTPDRQLFELCEPDQGDTPHTP